MASFISLTLSSGVFNTLVKYSQQLTVCRTSLTTDTAWTKSSPYTGWAWQWRLFTCAMRTSFCFLSLALLSARLSYEIRCTYYLFCCDNLQKDYDHHLVCQLRTSRTIIVSLKNTDLKFHSSFADTHAALTRWTINLKASFCQKQTQLEQPIPSCLKSLYQSKAWFTTIRTKMRIIRMRWNLIFI